MSTSLPKSRRSGKIVCSNDSLIFQLIANPNYEVRADGTIWTRITKTGKVSVNNVWRQAGSVHDGYVVIKYYGRMLRAHRIVYAKMHGWLKEDLVINHIDGNRVNNAIENLELVTQSKNCFHRFRKNGGSPPVMGNTVLSWEIVRDIRARYSTGQVTYHDLSYIFEISKGHVSQIINNEIWIEGKAYAGKSQNN